MIALEEASPRPFNDTIFKDNPWCVALGDPGSGKSTSLKKLLLDYAEKAKDRSSTHYSAIPIFIPLRFFASGHYAKGQGYSILDFIYDYAKGMLSASCSRGFFEHFLDAGECLVCLDGLDEVVVPGQRQEVQKLVEAFIRRYPRNRYIITSRKVGYDEAPLSSRLFPHFIVQPLSEEDINTYVHQWYATREKSQSEAERRANELFDTIIKSERLRELASNPLLLAIIALVHRIEAELPHERVKLYDKCSEALLTTFETVKRLERTDYDKEYYRYRRWILESVAFWMQAALATNAGREVIVSEADLQLYVAQQLTEDSTFHLNQADAWQQAEAFIKLMKERTGLLIDRGEKQFGFIHLTFQEYFTAGYIHRTYIYDSDQMWKQIEPHLVDQAWREVILLLLGKLNEYVRMPSMMVERIMANTDEVEHILRRRLSLATGCIADHIRLDTSLQARIVNEWIDILQSPLCSAQTNLALEALSTIKQHALVQESMQRLASDATKPTELCISIASLYVSEGNIPDWAFQTLSNIACDQNVPRKERMLALADTLRSNSHTDEARELILKLMKMDHESISICASVFIYDEYRSRLQKWFFSEKVQSSDGTARQAKRKTVWKKQDFDHFVGVDPRFIIIFGSVGKRDYWPYLIECTQESNQTTEQLIKLLNTEYRITKQDVPKRYQKKLTKSLVDIAKRQICDNESLITLFYWLKVLEYRIENLFNLLIEIDSMFQRDEWDIPTVYSLFYGLFNIGLEKYRKIIHLWIARTVESKHLNFKIGFFECLIDCINANTSDIIDANTLDMIQNVLELINTNDVRYYSSSMMNIIYENKKHEFLKFLFKNSKSEWIKYDSIKYLYQLGEMNSQIAIENLLEIATQEQDDVRLKLYMADLLADLGAVDRVTQILGEMITGAHTNEGDKSSAFYNLQRIAATNLNR